MIALLSKLLLQERVSILGFGKEGQSSYQYIRKYHPEKKLYISDININLLTENPYLKEDKNIEIIIGEKYLDVLDNTDIVIKSPGVNINRDSTAIPWHKIHTQTSLFLSTFHHQTIGVTGTKGKSTTSTLIYHLLSYSGLHSILLGNIGTPPFDRIEEIGEQTTVVFEMSAHQLEHLCISPHIAVLLNLFQEHLDYFGNIDSYYKSKLNIAKYQIEGDIFIYNADEASIQQYLSNMEIKGEIFHISTIGLPSNGSSIDKNNNICIYFENKLQWSLTVNPNWNLKGAHNLFNIQAAIIAAFCRGISPESINRALTTFKGLDHRLEFVGEYEGIIFYNDSIATIPEAVIQAVETLEIVDTLILGGFDRGIDYSILVDFLNNANIPNLIFTGKAGQRIFQLLKENTLTSSQMFISENYAEIVEIAKKQTNPGRVCLLSPAAASYDAFKNFEERGNYYKSLIKNT